MPTPSVQAPQLIIAPGRVGPLGHGVGLMVLYGASQPSSNESSMPTTSLKFPFLIPANFNLNRRKKICFHEVYQK